MEPERIGPYRLERKLGAGGMGVVYAAWDERLDRRVVLKQIRPGVARGLRREARAVAQLDHPAVVCIHELLETPDGDWLVLQYVEGTTLAQRLRDGLLPPERGRGPRPGRPGGGARAGPAAPRPQDRERHAHAVRPLNTLNG